MRDRNSTKTLFRLKSRHRDKRRHQARPGNKTLHLWHSCVLWLSLAFQTCNAKGILQQLMLYIDTSLLLEWDVVVDSRVYWAPILERVWARYKWDPREKVFEICVRSVREMSQIWAKSEAKPDPNLIEFLFENFGAQWWLLAWSNCCFHVCNMFITPIGRVGLHLTLITLFFT